MLGTAFNPFAFAIKFCKSFLLLPFITTASSEDKLEGAAICSLSADFLPLNSTHVMLTNFNKVNAQKPLVELFSPPDVLKLAAREQDECLENKCNIVERKFDLFVDLLAVGMPVEGVIEAFTRYPQFLFMATSKTNYLSLFHYLVTSSNLEALKFFFEENSIKNLCEDQNYDIYSTVTAEQNPEWVGLDALSLACAFGRKHIVIYLLKHTDFLKNQVQELNERNNCLLYSNHVDRTITHAIKALRPKYYKELNAAKNEIRKKAQRVISTYPSVDTVANIGLSLGVGGLIVGVACCLYTPKQREKKSISETSVPYTERVFLKKGRARRA